MTSKNQVTNMVDSKVFPGGSVQFNKTSTNEHMCSQCTFGDQIFKAVINTQQRKTKEKEQSGMNIEDHRSANATAPQNGGKHVTMAMPFPFRRLLLTSTSRTLAHSRRLTTTPPQTEAHTCNSTTNPGADITIQPTSLTTLCCQS